MTKPPLSDIHALVQLFAVRGGCDGVVLLTGDYKSAIAHYPSTAKIFLLQTNKSSISAAEASNLPPNVAQLPLSSATAEFLHSKIFICVDYLDNKRYFYRAYGHRAIAEVSASAILSVWALRHPGSWTARKLRRLLHTNKTALVGQHHSGTLLAIDGLLTNVYKDNYSLVRVLAVISQFNESDIIEPVISHLLSQGVDVHVIDNWSNDGSYEAVEALSKIHPDRITLERFPKHNTNSYEWTKILRRVTEVAKERPQYRWIMSNDADEIRWSPWPGVSLQRAISFIDHVGFNLIDYTVFNFYPTADGYRQGMNPLKFFKYGDFGHEGWHFMQLKTWRSNPKADIASSGGHLASLPDAKIFPIKFFLSHYSIRSNQQASKKVFTDRKPRFTATEKQKGWHSHYDKIKESTNFIRDQHSLIRTNNGQLSGDFLLERISGISIKINQIKNDGFKSYS